MRESGLSIRFDGAGPARQLQISPPLRKSGLVSDVAQDSAVKPSIGTSNGKGNR
jgi:hypothetical protein